MPPLKYMCTHMIAGGQVGGRMCGVLCSSGSGLASHMNGHRRETTARGSASTGGGAEGGGGRAGSGRSTSGTGVSGSRIGSTGSSGPAVDARPEGHDRADGTSDNTTGLTTFVYDVGGGAPPDDGVADLPAISRKRGSDALVDDDDGEPVDGDERDGGRLRDGRLSWRQWLGLEDESDWAKSENLSMRRAAAYSPFQQRLTDWLLRAGVSEQFANELLHVLERARPGDVEQLPLRVRTLYARLNSGAMASGVCVPSLSTSSEAVRSSLQKRPGH